jgi:hypothetical protein
MQNSSGIVLKEPCLLKDDMQVDRVSWTMQDNLGVYMTLAQIGKLAGVEKEASVASRIRDLRTHGFNIERRPHPESSRKNRVFEYALI